MFNVISYFVIRLIFRYNADVYNFHYDIRGIPFDFIFTCNYIVKLQIPFRFGNTIKKTEQRVYVCMIRSNTSVRLSL